MPTIDETMAWTVEDVLLQIRQHLPQDWVFRQREAERIFIVTLTRPDGAIAWQDTQADLRLALLNAYGWLFTRNLKPTHPTWAVRQSELTPTIVQGQVEGSSVPDPEDLDPIQIRSVYEKRSGQK